MSKQAPSWAEQWDAGRSDAYHYEDEDERQVDKKSNKKLDAAKAAAAVGMEKAKAGAAISAQKVKNGTSGGFKWLKSQCTRCCQRREPLMKIGGASIEGSDQPHSRCLVIERFKAARNR